MQALLDDGTIKIDIAQQQDVMRKKYLNKHPYKIYQGSDGRWTTYLPTPSGRIMKRKRTRKEIEDLVIDYWENQDYNPTLHEVFDEWNDRRRDLGKISDATHERYRQTFLRHCQNIADIGIKNLSSENIQDFLEEELYDKQMTAKAFSGLKTIIRGTLKRAKKRKLTTINISELFDDLDVSEHDFKKVIKEDYEEVFNESETKKIVTYLMDNLDINNLGILLIFVTGIRVGELVCLKHSDFDGNTFKIRRTETRKRLPGKSVYEVKEYPKTDAGIRTVIIPSSFNWLVSMIRKTNPFEEYIFSKNGKRMTTNAIRKRLERICKWNGIYPKSPHKIRKTYITILFDNHIDNNLIQQQVGHASVDIGEKHYHRNRKSIERKTEILSAIPDFKF